VKIHSYCKKGKHAQGVGTGSKDGAQKGKNAVRVKASHWQRSTWRGKGYPSAGRTPTRRTRGCLLGEDAHCQGKLSKHSKAKEKGGWEKKKSPNQCAKIKNLFRGGGDKPLPHWARRKAIPFCNGGKPNAVLVGAGPPGGTKHLAKKTKEGGRERKEGLRKKKKAGNEKRLEVAGPQPKYTRAEEKGELPEGDRSPRTWAKLPSPWPWAKNTQRKGLVHHTCLKGGTGRGRRTLPSNRHKVSEKKPRGRTRQADQPPVGRGKNGGKSDL